MINVPLLQSLKSPPPRAGGWPSRRGLANAGVVGLAAVVAFTAIRLGAFLLRDLPVTYEESAEHFKYGSIGSEATLGIPRPIFEVLPDLFEDLLPPGPGAGYERLGFSYEPGHALPVGTSVRRRSIPLVGLNCAACHAGTLRRTPGATPELLLGAPANRFNSGAFLQFLLEVGSDPRFEPGRLFAAMEQRRLSLSWPERAFYRLVVIPRMRGRLLRMRQQISWVQHHPPFGPGRVDMLGVDKVLFGMDPAADDSFGTVDYPPLYNQRLHQGSPVHWPADDAAAAGRVVQWSQDLQPPVFPREKIDLLRAERGRATWESECAHCHAIGGRLVGRVTSVTEVGTDPERLGTFTAAPAADGYPNALLDGIWARSPYLHNGSVPTLRALLFPEERPEVFFRGHDAFDWERVGYVSTGPDAEKAGFRFDTRLRGNHNTGHDYGTTLAASEKEDLLEYLKTL